jgi:hypothetical protein
MPVDDLAAAKVGLVEVHDDAVVLLEQADERLFRRRLAVAAVLGGECR